MRCRPERRSDDDGEGWKGGIFRQTGTCVSAEVGKGAGCDQAADRSGIGVISVPMRVESLVIFS